MMPPPCRLGRHPPCRAGFCGCRRTSGTLPHSDQSIRIGMGFQDCLSKTFNITGRHHPSHIFFTNHESQFRFGIGNSDYGFASSYHIIHPAWHRNTGHKGNHRDITGSQRNRMLLAGLIIQDCDIQQTMLFDMLCQPAFFSPKTDKKNLSVMLNLSST